MEKYETYQIVREKKPILRNMAEITWMKQT